MISENRLLLICLSMPVVLLHACSTDMDGTLMQDVIVSDDTDSTDSTTDETVEDDTGAETGDSDTGDSGSGNTETDQTSSDDPDSDEPGSDTVDPANPLDPDPDEEDASEEDPSEEDTEEDTVVVDDSETDATDLEATTAYCQAVADWEDQWAAFEEEVLELVNVRRADGANCGSQGSFSSTHALVMNNLLRCAARNHSMDMAENGYFSHTNLDGESPGDRVDKAEYEWSRWGENIAAGQVTPQHVVDAWMGSDGHCANIMSPNFTEIGVGYYDVNFWTQVFGTPR